MVAIQLLLITLLSISLHGPIGADFADESSKILVFVLNVGSAGVGHEAGLPFPGRCYRQLVLVRKNGSDDVFLGGMRREDGNGNCVVTLSNVTFRHTGEYSNQLKGKNEDPTFTSVRIHLIVIGLRYGTHQITGNPSPVSRSSGVQYDDIIHLIQHTQAFLRITYNETTPVIVNVSANSTVSTDGHYATKEVHHADQTIKHTLTVDMLPLQKIEFIVSFRLPYGGSRVVEEMKFIVGVQYTREDSTNNNRVPKNGESSPMTSGVSVGDCKAALAAVICLSLLCFSLGVLVFYCSRKSKKK